MENFWDNETSNTGIEVDTVELSENIKKAIRLTLLVEDLELQLSEAKRSYNELLSLIIPTQMAEAGAKEWRDLETDYKITLDHMVNSKLPADPAKKDEILAKLAPLGVEEIIKEEVIFKFPRGDNRPAMLIDYAEREGLPCEKSVSIHPSTFKKFLMDKIREGHGPEISEAGIWHGNRAKVTKPRGK